MRPLARQQYLEELVTDVRSHLCSSTGASAWPFALFALAWCDLGMARTAAPDNGLRACLRRWEHRTALGDVPQLGHPSGGPAGASSHCGSAPGQTVPRYRGGEGRTPRTPRRWEGDEHGRLWPEAAWLTISPEVGRSRPGSRQDVALPACERAVGCCVTLPGKIVRVHRWQRLMAGMHPPSSSQSGMPGEPQRLRLGRIMALRMIYDENAGGVHIVDDELSTIEATRFVPPPCKGETLFALSNDDHGAPPVLSRLIGEGTDDRSREGGGATNWRLAPCCVNIQLARICRRWHYEVVQRPRNRGRKAGVVGFRQTGPKQEQPASYAVGTSSALHGTRRRIAGPRSLARGPCVRGSAVAAATHGTPRPAFPPHLTPQSRPWVTFAAQTPTLAGASRPEPPTQIGPSTALPSHTTSAPSRVSRWRRRGCDAGSSASGIGPLASVDAAGRGASRSGDPGKGKNDHGEVDPRIPWVRPHGVSAADPTGGSSAGPWAASPTPCAAPPAHGRPRLSTRILMRSTPRPRITPPKIGAREAPERDTRTILGRSQRDPTSTQIDVNAKQHQPYQIRGLRRPQRLRRQHGARRRQGTWRANPQAAATPEAVATSRVAAIQSAAAIPRAPPACPRDTPPERAESR